MAVRIETLSDLRDYIDNIIGKVVGTDEYAPHAPEVHSILIIITGCVMIHANLESIEIRTYNGDMANMMWFKSKYTSDRFCLFYDHKNKAISISKRVFTKATETFVSTMSCADIHDRFINLIKGKT